MVSSSRRAIRLAWALALGALWAACAKPSIDSPTPGEPLDGEVRLFHFDVGQADATLVWGPDGTILIDAGDWRASDVVPHLEAVGVESIDLLILTHPHADHIGQVPAVLREFEVREVWMSGWEHPSQTFERVLDAVLLSDAGYFEPRSGDSHTLGDLRVEVLHPVFPLEDVHDNVAVRVRFGNFAAVYTGDAEVEHEREMIERHGPELQAQLLQLGHHGSRTSSSLEFLQAVSPEIAIYSAAEDSQYNHPHDEVVARIQSLGIPLYGTAESGTIVVTADGEGDYSIQELGRGGESSPIHRVEEEAPAKVDEECIDINRADASELERIAHTGPARAEQIIEQRPFRSIAELERVPGLGEARVRDIEQEGLACVKSP